MRSFRERVFLLRVTLQIRDVQGRQKERNNLCRPWSVFLTGYGTEDAARMTCSAYRQDKREMLENLLY